MFSEMRFYDDYPMGAPSPWRLFLVLGLNFILLGLLIIIFPELLAYLAGGFLLINGALLLAIAWHYWQFGKNYHQWRRKWWVP